MKKQPNFPEELYLSEIETWRKSSQLHADNAIIQYKRVTEGLEEIYYEKTRNDAILSALNDGVIVFEIDSNKIIIFNKVASELLRKASKFAIGTQFDPLFESLNPTLLTFVRKQHIAAKKHKKHNKRQIISLENGVFLSCHYDELKIRDQIYGLVLLEDNTDIINAQNDLSKEKKLLEHRVQQRTEELKKEVEQKEEAKREAEVISLTDILTGLPNRRSFVVTLDNAIQHYRKNSQHPFTIFFIDLDGFKVINDTLGHFAGDILLIEVSKRMQRLVRTNDLCARIGGDEFIIILNGLNQQDKVISIVENLIKSIALPIDYKQNQRMNITASVGVYLHNNIGYESSTILTMADEAMYEAKTKGKNGYVLFDEQLHQKMQSKTHLTQLLSSAFSNNEFMVYFQPICNIDGHLIGAEALARWQHKGEMVSPSKFIPLLEQQGKIKEFTYYILNSVCLTLEMSPNFPCVSVNLSVQQFYDHDFLDFVDDIFTHRPELKKRINFEITESLFHQDPQSLIKGIKELRQRGFKIYIDDFGTGYSSFSYIRNFKADVIKIDREFVIDIENNQGNADLLKGMTALLQSIGLQVIIEGVENRQQVALIKSFSSDVSIQGFYFYRPMPFDEILNLFSQQKPSLTLIN